MAVIVTPASAGSSLPVATFTMSLTQGWDQIADEDGGRPLAAGDAIFLEVRRPASVIDGPPGWTAAGNGRVFWKIIGPPEHEQPPMFTARYAGEWEIQGYAIASDQIRPFDDSGSAVEWTR